MQRSMGEANSPTMCDHNNTAESLDIRIVHTPDIRIVHTPPEEIRDLGRVKIGDGGTAPARRPHRRDK